MSILWLIKQGKALYNDINNAVTKATWDENALSNQVNKFVEWVTAPRKSARSSFTTVSNPSKNFPWISQEDENEMFDILDTEFWGASEMEQKFALQWLYQQYLKIQWEKDLQARRDSAKMELAQRMWQSKSVKEQNEYMSMIRSSDLADLIKYNYRMQGFDTSSLNWQNDDEVVQEFLNNNPSYQHKFNRYMYWEQDIISLGKEIWWLEKNDWDKINSYLHKIWETAAWTIGQFWEWIDTWLQLLWEVLWIETSQDDAFANYVQKEYWTAIANLTDKDRFKAEKEFNKIKDWVQKNYEENKPTIQKAASKTAEWLVDIYYTAKNPLRMTWIKAWFWALWNLEELPLPEDDLLSRVVTDTWKWLTEWIWEMINTMWGIINKLPVAREFRNSLQTEEEKEEWDNTVWSMWLAWLVKWYWNMKTNWWFVKSLEWLWDNMWTVVEAFKNSTKAWAKALKQWETIWEAATKAWEAWIETVAKDKLEKAKVEEAELKKVNEERAEVREDLARRIWMWEENQAKTLDKSLSNLSKQEWFDKIETYKELDKFNKKAIDDLKKKQDEIAWDNPKHYIYDDLTMDVKWEKIAPIKEQLKKLREYAEETWDIDDIVKYKGLWKKLNNWSFDDKDLLSVRRSYTREFWQDAFKEWEVKAWMTADKAANLMKYWNEFIEKHTNMSKELRELDSELSTHYSLQWRLKKIKQQQTRALNKLNDIEEKWWKEEVWKWLSAAFNSIFVSVRSILFRISWDILKRALNDWKKKVNAYNMDDVLKERLELYNKLNQDLKTLKTPNEFIEKMKPYVDAAREMWLTLDWEDYVEEKARE